MKTTFQVAVQVCHGLVRPWKVMRVLMVERQLVFTPIDTSASHEVGSMIAHAAHHSRESLAFDIPTSEFLKSMNQRMEARLVSGSFVIRMAFSDSEQLSRMQGYFRTVTAMSKTSKI